MYFSMPFYIPIKFNQDTCNLKIQSFKEDEDDGLHCFIVSGTWVNAYYAVTRYSVELLREGLSFCGLLALFGCHRIWFIESVRNPRRAWLCLRWPRLRQSASWLTNQDHFQGHPSPSPPPGTMFSLRQARQCDELGDTSNNLIVIVVLPRSNLYPSSL